MNAHRGFMQGLRLMATRGAAMVVIGLTLGLLAPTTALQAQQTPTVLSETYQDWIVSCRPMPLEGAPEQRVCQVSQELRQREGNRLVLAIALGRNPEGLPVGTLLVPLGVTLAAGIRLNVDDVALSEHAARTCVVQGCVVDLALDSAAISRFAAGNKLNVVMRPDGKPDDTAITVSLLGFSAAWARLSALASL